jgi:hypothetical protein
MAIKQVEIPIYDSRGEEHTDRKVVVKEWAGRVVFFLYDAENVLDVQFECYFDDIERAWKAVKKF